MMVGLSCLAEAEHSFEVCKGVKRQRNRVIRCSEWIHSQVPALPHPTPNEFELFDLPPVEANTCTPYLHLLLGNCTRYAVYPGRLRWTGLWESGVAHTAYLSCPSTSTSTLTCPLTSVVTSAHPVHLNPHNRSDSPLKNKQLAHRLRIIAYLPSTFNLQNHRALARPSHA
jgi:hypothetical protein